MNKRDVLTGQLTREKMVLFIKSYHNKHGYMPTLEEIGNAVGLCKSSVHHQFSRLMQDGILETDHQCSPRAYRLNLKEKDEQVKEQFKFNENGENGEIREDE